jgi:hypothetical protein
MDFRLLFGKIAVASVIVLFLPRYRRLTGEMVSNTPPISQTFR